MSGCFCTGACLRGGGCAARTSADPFRFSGGIPGSKPLTADEVRQIVREEIGAARAGLFESTEPRRAA